MTVENGLFDNNIILKSEGIILEMVELKEEVEDVFAKPYLCVLCNKNADKIYTKINKTVLSLYFQGRLTLKELFLINLEEPYYIKKGDKITEIKYSEKFHDDYIENIESKNMIFYAMPKGNRIENPFENIMRYWDLFY